VLDGRLSDEKLAELLGLQAEYPELDFKRRVDPTTTEGLVELALDVGALQVRGAYVVAGVDGSGRPTGDLDDIDPQAFDEATLVPRLVRYLPEPLELRTRVLDRDGHRVVLIYVARSPSGCAIFRGDGQYERDGETVVRFRAGDVFWRNGTRTERLSQGGLEEIIERRIAATKAAWLDEQQEIRRHERGELQIAYESRQSAEGPLGSLSLDLDGESLAAAALELVRAGDDMAMIRLLNDAAARARSAIERGEVETELADVLDKLACLGAAFLAYERQEWFERVVGTLAQIYSMPLGEHDARRFGYATHIDPAEVAPRVWLQLIERIYGLGALAVRLRNWRAVRTLTLQLPERLDDEYDANWLRHALTMASRAQHLDEQGQHASLLSLARPVIERLSCLRPDGPAPDDEAVITSLARFDVLSNITAIDGAGDVDPRVFWPNFARFRQDRIQPIVERLLTDREMRESLFQGDDAELSLALAAIERVAHQEGFRHDGFMTWTRTPVGDFIEQHRPSER
jgi:hypothetical protein